MNTVFILLNDWNKGVGGGSGGRGGGGGGGGNQQLLTGTAALLILPLFSRGNSERKESVSA